MSYNGIGLSTTRGSATNGYVQKNLSNVRPPRDDFRKGTGSTADYRKREEQRVQHRQPDEGILEHERKRKIEVRCLELQLQLEEDGVEETKIEEQVAELRKKLLEQMAEQQQKAQQETKALRPSDTHAWGAAKADETRNLSRALGVRQDYKEGDAFDRDLQEKMKQERIEERKRRDEERVRAAEER
ncbi:cwf21-domain-containing protein, partial [Meira miltonrushii]